MVAARSLPEMPFLGGRAVQSIQSLWLALWLSLLCASWQTFSLARERRTSPKNRLTHGKESQCAKRLNNGPPEGGLDGKTSINNYIMLNGYDYWRGNKVGLFRMVTMLKPKIPYTQRTLYVGDSYIISTEKYYLPVSSSSYSSLSATTILLNSRKPVPAGMR